MNSILSRFPEIKPCYEKKIYTKPTNYDICFAIPKGKKFFGWFTYYLNKPVFFLVDVIKKNITLKYTSFDLKLCNTVIYGTQFYYKSNEIFSLEDILIFQSKHVNLYNFKEKQKLIDYIFKNLHCNQIEKKFLMFGTPYMSTNIDDLYKNKHIPYVVYSYQCRNLTKLSPYQNFITEKSLTNNFATFKVMADNRQDIYKLYCLDGFYGFACVSNLKISKLLNSIFRQIKESTNLDLLEESDDEEEFQNISDNKYNLNNIVFMRCKFNKKFNSWEPIDISKTKTLLPILQIKKMETV
tara:strand:+ start:104 stop:991 length:888 start_codon:yes stop_codon:yes gene_type:complete